MAKHTKYQTAYLRSESAAKRSLMRRAAGTPSDEIIGIVAPSGLGGGRSQGQTQFKFQVPFLAWRVKGSDVKRTPLVLYEWLGDRAVSNRMSAFAPYAICRVRARIASGSDGNTHEGLLLKVIGPATDRELAPIARKEQTPVRHHVPGIGTFTLDRRINWWTTRLPWKGAVKGRVQITIDTPALAGLKSAIPNARRVLRSPARWDQLARAYAARKFLKLANDWQREDSPTAPEIGEAEFLRRLKLESIGIGPRGKVDFSFDDGDLFFGHLIIVSGTLARGFTDSEMCG